MNAEAKPMLTLRVEVGEGAVHFIANPNEDPHIVRTLVYGGISHSTEKAARLSAASVMEGFEYLLSEHISMKEATRRLRLLRAAHQTAIKKLPIG